MGVLADKFQNGEFKRTEDLVSDDIVNFAKKNGITTTHAMCYLLGFKDKEFCIDKFGGKCPSYQRCEKIILK